MKVRDRFLDPYWIEIDPLQFILRKNNKQGTIVGYYTTLDSLVKRILREETAKQERELELKEFLAEYKALFDAIEIKMAEIQGTLKITFTT